MTVHAGTDGSVTIDGSAIGHLREWELDQQGNTSDTTTMGDVAETHVPTTYNWSGTATSYMDEVDAGQNAITVLAQIALVMQPEGSASGDTIFSGNATVTGITRSAAFDGIVEVEFSFQGNGVLAEGNIA